MDEYERRAEIRQALLRFIAEKRRATEIMIGPMRLYLRTGMRAAQSESGITCMGQTIEIANISVDQMHQRQGWATTTVQVAHEVNPFAMTYIEIASPPMRRIALREGFHPREGTWGDGDYFKPTDEERTCVQAMGDE